MRRTFSFPVRCSGNIDHRLSVTLPGGALPSVFPFPYLHKYVLGMEK
jgi:hypothetical protein